MITVLGLIGVPVAAGLAAYWLPSRPARRALLVVAAAIHTLLSMTLWRQPVQAVRGRWLGIDALGLTFLSIVSILFLASALYCLGYLKQEETAQHLDREEGFLFTNEPEAVFIACLLFFLASMTLVTVSQHLGLLWVGIEATTLASAPLIYFHRHHRSLEATWKYLVICSVGIALALLGNFLLSVATAPFATGKPQLIATDLLAQAGRLDTFWLKGALLFFLVGYGTKMGLAPMHTWLPDAHSEAPSPVSALLSGALLNCAFLGILRVHRLCLAAGEGAFSQSLLVTFGLISMAIAAVFIVRQADYKRMLAYSSVEHMGILALGVGLGGAGIFGAMFHAVNHSLTKAALFLVAGNILALFASKQVREVRGILAVLPVTGVLWVAGFLSITGTPPFATFLSEFTILKAALDTGHTAAAVLYLALLALIFVGMTNIVLNMAQGAASAESPRGSRHHPLMLIPPALLLALVLALGFAVPDRLDSAFRSVQQAFSGTAAVSASAEDRSLTAGDVTAPLALRQTPQTHR